MKKILSVMLAIMMLFGAMSINASAAGEVDNISDLWGTKVAEGVTVTKGTHVILVFDFGAGTSKLPLMVYDSTKGGFVETTGVTGTYVMLPKTSGSLTRGSMVTLPSVQAADGDDFVGWYCHADKEYYVSGADKYITDNWFTANNGSGIVYFTAKYEPREPETDTMATVLNILVKVFGTIIGILFLDGSSAAGVELVNKLLGGLL